MNFLTNFPRSLGLACLAVATAWPLTGWAEAGQRFQAPRPQFSKLSYTTHQPGPRFEVNYRNPRSRVSVQLGEPTAPRVQLSRLPTLPQVRFAEPTPAQMAELVKQEGKYPWRNSIVTTIFWVGEPAAPPNNPVANIASSWDSDWRGSFGGFDDPDRAARTKWIPAAFIPKQNPFYVALPYNDVKDRHITKAEASLVVPWFKETFQKPGVSVCRNRWLAIRKGNRVCYAQWSDCGPFRTDHWQYVFGNERPKPNLNRGAGLDVSPAVRDFLHLINGHDVTDWRFVEFDEVPDGPWAKLGSNNDFVKAEALLSRQRIASRR